MMSLTWKDGLATVFVAAAAVIYGLWLAGTDVFGITGTRALVVTLFVLGMAACITTRDQMGDVYGADGHDRAALPYVVLVSVVGAVALVAGIIAFAGGSEVALGTMVAATVALWLATTYRHAIARTPSRQESVAHSAR